MLFTGKQWLNVNSHVTQLLDSQHMRSRSQENSKTVFTFVLDYPYIDVLLLVFPIYASIAQTNLPFTSYNVLFCNLRSRAV